MTEGTNTQISDIIRKVKRRLYLNKIISSMLQAFMISLFIGMIVLMLARFMPIYDPVIKIGWIIGAAIIIGLIAGITRKPSDKNTAMLIDSFGYEERTLTALELMDTDTEFAKLQKRDTLNMIKDLNISGRVKITFSMRNILISFLIIIFMVIACVIPNPMNDKAEAIHKRYERKIEAVKKVNDVVERIKKNPAITKQQKRELQRIVNSLKKDVESSKSKKEIRQAVQKAAKKVALQRQKYENKELDRISKELGKNSATQKLASLVKNRDISGIKKELKNLSRKIKSMKSGDQKELGKDLKRLAKEINGSPSLKKALASVARDIQNGDTGNIDSEMSNLGKELAGAIGNDSKLNGDMKKLQDSLAKNSGMAGNDGKGNKSAEDNGTLSDDNGNSQGNGNGSGGGTGNGKGNGNGKGKGSGGSGKGQGGGGAGNGSDLGSENSQSGGNTSSGGIGKKDGSKKKLSKYEKIFTSSTLGGKGKKSTVKGNKGKGGNTSQTEDSSLTTRGESVPYDKVLGEYKQKAYSSMDEADIPDGMKDAVKEYFASLED